MALNIDLEGFGFLESDSDVAKLSPTLNKQPPISPIESESSSGISSLDSDDLKKQLLSSPTISQEDHDDDEAEQSDSGSSAESDVSGSDVTEKSDIKTDSSDTDEGVKTIDDVPIRTQIMYENRNILNLAQNVWNSGRFIQFTVLPENNVNCFFQNRAQYWRLANNNLNAADAMEKCSCCDFSHPPMAIGNLSKESATAKNAITDSLMTFLKNNVADYQSPIANNNPSSMPMHANQMNNNNVGHRRMYNNSAPYSAYQMMQQQQQQPQYPNNQSNGYYGNAGGYNQMNNGGIGGGYNGSALTLLNLMNASRNVTSAGAAFQATLNNSTRYFNNNNMNTNNGFGLYKQF